MKLIEIKLKGAYKMREGGGGGGGGGGGRGWGHNYFHDLPNIYIFYPKYLCEKISSNKL